MFNRTSRYYDIETATVQVTGSDGVQRQLAYKRRRFVPPVGALTTVVEHIFTQGERLDLVTATYLDDPGQFWRICDANDIRHPAELERIGRTIVIAVPTQ